MRIPIAAVAIVLTSIAVSVLAVAQDSPEDELHVVVPRDAIPAIDHPEFEPLGSAEQHMSNNELVIGLVGASGQRAYSTWQLDRHEIVNDTFEGRPVAVTWCPLCGTGIVYARRVAGRTLTFGVSGMLFRDGLVMYDRETDTLWTHVDGRAIKGKLRGQSLEIVPSIHATWSEWKALYPRSLVLKKPGGMRSSYEAYAGNPRQMGVLGRRLRDQRLPGKERIIGIRSTDGATAFVEKDVRLARLVETQVGSLPVVLVTPGENRPVLAFERRVAGRLLSFRAASDDPMTIVDGETGSRWSLATGEAGSGPLQGNTLRRAPANPAFWFGWQSYFPGTEVWGRAQRQPAD
jgi:hypothetical protein